MKSLFIMGAAGSGKTAVALGLALKMQEEGFRVAYFKPVGSSARPGLPDADALLMRQALSMEVPLETIVPCTAGPSYLSRNLPKDRLAAIKDSYREVSRGADCVIVDGASFPHVLAASGLDSVSLAGEFGAVALNVIRVKNDFSLDLAVFFNRYLADRGVPSAGNLFSHVERSLQAKIEGVYRPILDGLGYRTAGIIPLRTEIALPTVGEYFDVLGGEILAGEERLGLLVEEVVVGAMTIESALSYLRRTTNKAVVIGGDRADLALAALETSTSALILTGGLYPDVKVLARAAEKGVPVILVHYDTYATVEKMAAVSRHLKPGDQQGIRLALENIEHYCDWQGILQVLKEQE
ncbi:MAG: AAA family ATPase [Firmicutes bacterium]|nr:AAA family ATPase [Bacillota bacterium]